MLLFIPTAAATATNTNTTKLNIHPIPLLRPNHRPPILHLIQPNTKITPSRSRKKEIRQPIQILGRIRITDPIPDKWKHPPLRPSTDTSRNV